MLNELGCWFETIDVPHSLVHEPVLRVLSFPDIVFGTPRIRWMLSNTLTWDQLGVQLSLYL